MGTAASTAAVTTRLMREFANGHATTGIPPAADRSIPRLAARLAWERGVQPVRHYFGGLPAETTEKSVVAGAWRH